MNKYFYLIFIILIFLSKDNFSQVENITTDNSIYQYLDQMYTRGILNEYSNVILPFSKGKIQKALIEIEANKNNLSETELIIK